MTAMEEALATTSADNRIDTAAIVPTASLPVATTPLSKLTRLYFLFVFCYLQLLSSMVLNGFFSIGTSVAKFYDVSVERVNVMGTSVYLLAALKFPAMYWTERFGVLPGLLVGISFFTLGTAVVRPFLACPGGVPDSQLAYPPHNATTAALGRISHLLRDDDEAKSTPHIDLAMQQGPRSGFTFLFLGTVIAQIGQPFFQCLAASLPTHYWPENARSLPTALGIAADTTGVGAGMFVCGLPVFATDPRVFIRFTAIASAVGVFLLLPVLYLVPNRGKRSPARSSAVAIAAPAAASSPLARFPLLDGMYLLFRFCPEFAYAFLGISVLFGVFCAHLSVISEVFPHSVSANIYAGLFYLVGLGGNIVQGLLLDSKRFTHAKLIQTVILVLFVLFTITAFIWTACSDHFGFLLYPLAALLGIGGPGLLATSIGFVLSAPSYAHVETSLLKGSNLESTVTGLMLMGFCLVAAVLNVVLNPEVLGPAVGGQHLLPWIWVAISIPGYLLLWKACAIR